MGFHRGDLVRMTAAFKAAQRAKNAKLRDRGVLDGDESDDHVAEFGDCVGVVDGPCDYGNGVVYPELDVRWRPSGLRYGYHPDHLEAADMTPKQPSLPEINMASERIRLPKGWNFVSRSENLPPQGRWARLLRWLDDRPAVAGAVGGAAFAMLVLALKWWLFPQ